VPSDIGIFHACIGDFKSCKLYQQPHSRCSFQVEMNQYLGEKIGLKYFPDCNIQD
jgi:hypothetical protein